MTLLAVLARVSVGSRARLVVAHFDHALRGEESDGDRAAVAAAATRFGVTFEAARGPGDRRDEATLRRARWEFLETVRIRHGADVVATAHHGGDQLETLLLRCLRGTGPRGLAAMRERDGGRWRPWLAIAPETIAAWARANGVAWREDASNGDVSYARNALRRTVLPPLLAEASRYGGPESFYARLAETCAETGRLVDAADRAALAGLDATRTSFFVRYASEATVDDGTVEALAVHLGRPLVREQRRRALTASRTTSRSDWGNGLEWSRSCGFDYVTTPPMRDALARWRQAAGAALTEGASATPAPVEWRLTAPSRGRWRLVHPGDRYRNDKLKRRFLEARVPRPERALQVVLAEGDLVLWAPLPGAERLAAAPAFPFAVTIR